MATFLQQLLGGLSDGAIYASLALALVLIYRATHVINFAQGEMGMFSAYVAWALINHHGLPYWVAFFLTLALSFAGGVAIQQVVIRPLARGGSELTVVMATIALLVILDGLASWIWGPDEKFLPGPFPNRSWNVGGVQVSELDVGTLAVVCASVVLLWAFFRFTKLGLALRAAAVGPDASRLLGVRVGWMLAVGWGLAAVLSALAALLAGPSLFVITPTFMQSILIYAFAAAVLGGIESPVGAVVGGLAIGVTVDLLGAYVHPIGSSLQLPVALAILLAVLIVRPAGLLGRVAVRRV